MEIITVNTDVLVIGGGLAGLSAALKAKEQDSKVTIVAKSKVGSGGNSLMTRNGMAAVMEEGYNGDCVELHVADTLKGGAYLNNQKLVYYFASGAPEAINYLRQQGVLFLTENGQLLRKGSPGHSRKRFLTAYRSMAKSSRNEGLALTKPLYDRVQEAGIDTFDKILITELLRDEQGNVIGALGLDKGHERIMVFLAAATILAGGGAGRLFLNNTNAGDVTGDAYALASLTGAELKGMEFIQFHPAVVLEGTRMVMSTAIFAEGAILRNADGVAFMSHYSQEAEMANRDVMARAIYTEIQEGRGTKNGRVYLDISAIDANNMERNYKPLADYLKERDTIEVAPAAHFIMGGVSIDSSCRTAVQGLFAAGEAAGGLHGANRLAGNALTEAAVFGLRAGEEAADYSSENEINATQAPDESYLKDKYAYNPAADEKQNRFSDLRSQLYKVINDNVGIVRTENGLKQALQSVEQWREEIETAAPNGYKQLLEKQQLKLMLIAAESIIRAALVRKESIGSHYRVN